jgi:hypothetical protein
MASKKATKESTLEKIEQEERRIEDTLKKIEKEECAIEAEERRIEGKEDLLRMFEELGLMRWKSYYVLTAGAILLLSLTFVTALWVMHDQVVEVQTSLSTVSAQLDSIESKLSSSVSEWCPVGQVITLAEGPPGSGIPSLRAEIVGITTLDGMEVCHGQVTSEGKTADIYLDKSGGIQQITTQ